MSRQKWILISVYELMELQRKMDEDFMLVVLASGLFANRTKDTVRKKIKGNAVEFELFRDNKQSRITIELLEEREALAVNKETIIFP